MVVVSLGHRSFIFRHLTKYTSPVTIVVLVMVILVIAWSSILLRPVGQHTKVYRDAWNGKQKDTGKDAEPKYHGRVANTPPLMSTYPIVMDTHRRKEPRSRAGPKQAATAVSDRSRSEAMQTKVKKSYRAETQTHAVDKSSSLIRIWSGYYGLKQTSRYARVNLKHDCPIPSLIPDSAPPNDISPLIIASYDNSMTEKHLIGQKTAATYILSSFLKKYNRQYIAVIYAQPMFNNVSKVPDLTIFVNFPDVSSDKLACEKLWENEKQMPYTDSRAIQAHFCPIPDEIQALLENGKMRVLNASLRAAGHEHVVNISLAEWHPEYGHIRPSKVYNFTIAMLIKTDYQRCVGGRCEAPVVQRLAENVAHHILLGFDHIYIYCVDGWDIVQQVLRPFVQMGKVTVIVAKDSRFPPIGRLQNAQVLVFSSHNERYREYSKYFFIHDPDEMLYISPDLQLPDGARFPEYLDSMLARYVYKQELKFQLKGQKLCGLSFCWFIIGPDEPRPNSTSIINSFHRSYYRDPPRCDAGRSKTMTRSIYTSPYANQHVASFREGTGCWRTYAGIQEAILVHYRSIEPRTQVSSVDFQYTQTFMDSLYPGVEQLLRDLEIW